MASKFGIGQCATSIANDGQMTNITYHATQVVSFDDASIILRTRGHYTVTTKRRMNEASKVFGLGISVYQTKFDWFVTWRGQTYCFWDGMRLDRQSGIVYRPPEGRIYSHLPQDSMMILEPIAA